MLRRFSRHPQLVLGGYHHTTTILRSCAAPAAYAQNVGRERRGRTIPDRRGRTISDRRGCGDAAGYGTFLLSDDFLRRCGFDVDKESQMSAALTSLGGSSTEMDQASATEMLLGCVPDVDATPPAPIVFDVQQQDAIRGAIDDRRNLFVTGGAGTGKTLVIREIVQRLRLAGKKVAVTATTGVAALNCGGSTLHHFVGMTMKMKDLPPEALAATITKKRTIVKRICDTDVLVIDEVSMLEAGLLDKIHAIAQSCRNNFVAPFGGLQIIFCGDFLQLPPVAPRGAAMPYAFFSPLWGALNLQVVQLSTKFRQAADMDFQQLLDAVRAAQLTPAQVDSLKSRVRDSEQIDDNYVRLYGSNKEVDARNIRCFARLSPRLGEPVTARLPLMNYTAVDARTSKGSGLNLSDGRFPQSLPLKVGTKVMLVQNMCVKAGLVNGSVGTVTGFLNPVEAMHLVAGVFEQRKKPNFVDVVTEELMAQSGIHGRSAAMRLFDGAVNRTFYGSLRLKSLRSTSPIRLSDIYTHAQITELVGVSQCPVSPDAAANMTREQWAALPVQYSLRYPVVLFDTPVAQTQSAIHVLVSPSREEWYVGEDLAATRSQVALRHSWAMTVHKSQGLTIRNLAVDMSKFFSPGQAYVALSRGVSLAGLTLTNFNARGIFSCSVAKQFYADLSQAAAAMAPEEEFGEVPPEIAAAGGASAVPTTAADAAEGAAGPVGSAAGETIPTPLPEDAMDSEN